MRRERYLLYLSWIVSLEDGVVKKPRLCKTFTPHENSTCVMIMHARLSKHVQGGCRDNLEMAVSRQAGDLVHLPS